MQLKSPPSTLRADADVAAPPLMKVRSTSRGEALSLLLDQCLQRPNEEASTPAAIRTPTVSTVTASSTTYSASSSSASNVFSSGRSSLRQAIARARELAMDANGGGGSGGSSGDGGGYRSGGSPASQEASGGLEKLIAEARAPGFKWRYP